MAVLVLCVAGKARADEVPAWIEREISGQAPAIATVLGLPRVPFIEAEFTSEPEVPGLRVVDAFAEPERITIRLSGPWQEESAESRRQLVRNLAHELAHVWQLSYGLPTEPRFFHEGFAEAIAVDALAQCGLVCGGDVRELAYDLRSDCGQAMREGSLIRNESRRSVYGCGAVLTSMAADVSQMESRALYERYAATDRTVPAFLDLVEETAGKGFALSARTFLTGDFRLAQPRHVLERLRAGRL